MDDLVSVVDWSRAQFALTAMYHWIFVPLTLGLAIIIGIMETIYYRTKDETWKVITKYWMTLFGINFAIGIATGIILEFQFGTNWSNYSWFVGDIFGAPLAIEGIFAFFLEATFVAIMFFGWNKVSRGFHLASTWITAIGASLSAFWILVANAWMQYPIGMQFNPDTVRNEMVDFWAIVSSPIALNKFFHAVTSSWVLAAAFVIGVSAWYLLKGRERVLATRSIRIAAWVGLVGLLLTIYTGDGSAYHVAQKQPMKLAAMEGLYHGGNAQSLVAFGVLNPAKKSYNDGIDPFIFKLEIPYLLSALSTRSLVGYVPGISDIINGDYLDSAGNQGLSVTRKMERGNEAILALAAYKKAVADNNENEATLQRTILEENYLYFGYGYLRQTTDVIPNVPLVFYSFRIMVILGIYFLLLFIFLLIYDIDHKLPRLRWLLWICLFSIPLAYICSQSGWIVAEVGRQPWVIQDIMPTYAAISRIESNAVIVTFTLFAVLFSILLIAELGIMIKQIKKGTTQES